MYTRTLSYEKINECVVSHQRVFLKPQLKGKDCRVLRLEALRRFELLIDEMPVGREARRRYGWRPYVASLAVDATERRRGLGRLLMREAERTARSWGYREIMLEVAKGNDDALSFYSRLGYQVINEDEKGTGATVVREVSTPLGKAWSVDNVEKLLMSKGVRLLL